MNKRAVEKYIKEKQLFTNFKVAWLGRGNNSNVFRVETDQALYTFRVGRPDRTQPSHYRAHFLALKFLAYAKVDFVPRPEYFNARDDVLVTTFAPGEPITAQGLTPAQLKLFVQQLFVLNSLKYTQYQKFYQAEKLKTPTIVTPLDNIKEFGVKRLRQLRSRGTDQALLAWIEPKLKDNLAYLQAHPWRRQDLIFTHGDLTGANITSHQDSLYFIDWERARFEYNLNHGLSYLFVHYEFFNKQCARIIALYAEFAGLDPEELKTKVFWGIKTIKINDVIWAATQCSEQPQDQKKYSGLLRQRMADYEKLTKL